MEIDDVFAEVISSITYYTLFLLIEKKIHDVFTRYTS